MFPLDRRDRQIKIEMPIQYTQSKAILSLSSPIEADRRCVTSIKATLFCGRLFYLIGRRYTVQLCEIHLLSFIFWKVSWKQFFFCQFMKNKSPNHSLTYTICIIYKCTSFYFILNNFNLREKNDNHLLCDSLVYSIFHSNNALDLSNFHIIFHSYYYVFFYYVV